MVLLLRQLCYCHPDSPVASEKPQDADKSKRLESWLILHEITAHRIEQWKRERLAGKWRAAGQVSAPKGIRPATVNRELDTLRAMLAKAVEWGYLLESPVTRVKRLRLDNRRTRVLTPDEQRALLAACPRRFRAIVGAACEASRPGSAPPWPPPGQRRGARR